MGQKKEKTMWLASNYHENSARLCLQWQLLFQFPIRAKRNERGHLNKFFSKIIAWKSLRRLRVSFVSAVDPSAVNNNDDGTNVID